MTMVTKILKAFFQATVTIQTGNSWLAAFDIAVGMMWK